MQIHASVIHDVSKLIQLKDEGNRSIAQIKVPQRDTVSVAMGLLLGVLPNDIHEQVSKLVYDNAPEHHLPKAK